MEVPESAPLIQRSAKINMLAGTESYERISISDFMIFYGDFRT